MIAPDMHYRKYHSAKQRFLKQLIVNFFAKEMPKLFGPSLRELLANELTKLVSKAMPEKEHLKPGQMVWTAVDQRTRPDSPKRRFVPVVLTLIDEQDIEQLANATKMSAIAENAIARITKEAHQQGALLSMRDIGLFSWRASSDISKKRKAYEKRHNVTLPHTGSLQDMGTCLSHKAVILRKILLEKKDPIQVASETNHSLRAVENYIKDFRRTQTCYKFNQNIDFISQATGLSNHVIKQYIAIIQQHPNSP